MIYKKYEITKTKSNKGFIYIVSTPDKDDYFFDAKTLLTCKKWIDKQPFPYRPKAKKK